MNHGKRHENTIHLDFVPKPGEKVKLDGATISVRTLFNRNDGNYMLYTYDDALPEYRDTICSSRIECMNARHQDGTVTHIVQ